jgi:hypothetical protein
MARGEYFAGSRAAANPRAEQISRDYAGRRVALNALLRRRPASAPAIAVRPNTFKRVDREVKDMPRDLPKVIEIGKDAGIHFLPAA